MKHAIQPVQPPYNTGLYDLNYNYASFVKNKGVILPSSGKLACPLPQFPYVFDNGIYRFSDWTVDFLRNMFNDNYAAFRNFTQLMFSAYNSDLPIKKATVIAMAIIFLCVRK